MNISRWKEMWLQGNCDFWRGISMSPCSGLKAKNTLKTWTMILWMCTWAHTKDITSRVQGRPGWYSLTTVCFHDSQEPKRWCYGRWQRCWSCNTLIQCYRGRAEQSAAPVHLCFSRKKYMINKLFNRQSTKLSVCCLFLTQDVSA